MKTTKGIFDLENEENKHCPIALGQVEQRSLGFQNHSIIFTLWFYNLAIDLSFLQKFTKKILKKM